MQDFFQQNQILFQFFEHVLAIFGAYKALEIIIPWARGYVRQNWQAVGIALCLALIVYAVANGDAWGASAGDLRDTEADPFLIPGWWQICLLFGLMICGLLVWLTWLLKIANQPILSGIGAPAILGMCCALAFSICGKPLFYFTGWSIFAVGLISGPAVWFDWPAIYRRLKAWFTAKGGWRWLLRGTVKGCIVYLAACQIADWISPILKGIEPNLTLALAGLGLTIAGRC